MALALFEGFERGVLDPTERYLDRLGEFPRDLARSVAGSFRGEALSVRTPPLPFGEFLAESAERLASAAVRAFGPGIRPVGAAHDRVTGFIQDALGISVPGEVEPDPRPRMRSLGGSYRQDFLVDVPEFSDVFVVSNDRIFSEQSRIEQARDVAERLRRSPTPPGVRELGELVTIVDDLQDEAATLAVGLSLVERAAGRSIPGVGQVALVADALNTIQGVLGPGLGSFQQGCRGRARVVQKAGVTRNGLSGRVQELRRTGRFGLNFGDVLQGAQATENVFGTGIVLGPVVGLVQDSVFGLLRGAQFRFPGPVWDPLNFSRRAAESSTRSPTLAQLHPSAGFVLSHKALSVWSAAGRLLPWIDVLGEPVLASLLTGMRLAEGVLGPWLRSGDWFDLVEPLVRRDEVVRGGSAALGTAGLSASEYVRRAGPLGVAALGRAIGSVGVPERQGLYEQLVAEIGWGLLGSVDPAAMVGPFEVVGPLRDVVLVLRNGLDPRGPVGFGDRRGD